MNITAIIRNDNDIVEVKNISIGAFGDKDDVVNLIYLADITHQFPFESLPPLFFVTDGGANAKVLITEITGETTRQLSPDRSVSILEAALTLGEPSRNTKLINAKTGDWFRHNDEFYIVTNRPDKAKDGCIWAVPLLGDKGRAFENDWIMENVYQNVSIKLTADLLEQ